MPVQWAILEGSPTDASPETIDGIPGDTIDTVLDRRLERLVLEVFFRQHSIFDFPVGILLRRAGTTEDTTRCKASAFEPPPICVHDERRFTPDDTIRLHDPDLTVGLPGDILDPEISTAELDLVWESLRSNISTRVQVFGCNDCQPPPYVSFLTVRTPEVGPAILNIGRFVDANGNPTARRYWYHADVRFPRFGPGETEEDVLCRRPEDIPVAWMPFIFVADRVWTKAADPRDLFLAQAVARTLFLSEGNGLDDDQNGVFDAFCDPLENPEAAPRTLMRLNTPSRRLTGLQAERVRLFSQKYRATGRRQALSCLLTPEFCPPMIGPPPPPAEPGPVQGGIAYDSIDELSEGLDIVTVEIAENREQSTTSLSHELRRPIPFLIRPADFVVFADLDSNPSTGGDASLLGFSIPFSGAELVTRTRVLPNTGSGRVAVPTVWKFDGANLTEVMDPGIVAEVRPILDNESGRHLRDRVSIELPNGVRGPAGPLIRLAALTISQNGELDWLPDGAQQGEATGWSLAGPPLSHVEIDDGFGPLGSTIRIRLVDYSRDATVRLVLDGHVVGTGRTDASGQALIDVAIPLNTRPGANVIFVRTEVEPGRFLDAGSGILPVTCGNVVTFDADQAAAVLPRGVDISGNRLQDLGVRLTGRSGSTGSPGVFTNEEAPPPAETDDLFPVTGNFITTLPHPGDPDRSDFGSICADFVDPVSHLPRTVGFTQVTFLDVEDSIGRLTAFSGPGCTGSVIDVATTTENGTLDNQENGNRETLFVGAPGSSLAIASIGIEFGGPADSAAVDHLCFEFTGTAVEISSDRGGEVFNLAPAVPFPVQLHATNEAESPFLGRFIQFAVLRADDPYRHDVRILSQRDVRLPAHGVVSRGVSYTIPTRYGSRHLGERLTFGQMLATRAGIVLARTTETVLIVP